MLTRDEHRTRAEELLRNADKAVDEALLRDGLSDTDAAMLLMRQAQVHALLARVADEQPARRCVTCNSNAWIAGPGWADWNTAYRTAPSSAGLELLMANKPDGPEEIPCPRCNGGAS